MTWLEEKENNLILNLRIIPRASKDEIAGCLGDALKIRIQAPPVEGKANQYLIKFLSKHWKIPRRNIELLSGETGRNKRIKLIDPSTELRKKLSEI